MKCLACGAELPSSASFCSACGAKVAGAASASIGATSKSEPTDSAADRLRRAAPSSSAEEVLWSGGYSGKAMLGSWILGIIVSVALAVGCVLFPPGLPVFLALIGLIWLTLAITLVYRKMNLRYELTTQRLNHSRGILSRRHDRIEVIDIDDVTFDQGVVQRMLGVGRIKITSSDRTDPELVLIGIDDVKVVANLIDGARREERRKRAIHIESV